jgi:hypothetical protein
MRKMPPIINSIAFSQDFTIKVQAFVVIELYFYTHTKERLELSYCFLGLAELLM